MIEKMISNNYYVVFPFKEDEKKKLHGLIENNNFMEIQKNIDMLSISKVFFIGTLSEGWKFYFSFNNWENSSHSINEFKDFLSKGKIFDDSGKEYTMEDFFNIVDNWNSDSNNDMDMEKYFTKYPLERYSTPFNFKAEVIDGYYFKNI